MRERRRSARVGGSGIARVQIDNLLIVDARILDISRNGALFELKDACVFHHGDRWRLRFNLPGSDILLDLETEVVHSRGMRIGVRFVGIDEENLAHLAALLENVGSLGGGPRNKPSGINSAVGG